MKRDLARFIGATTNADESRELVSLRWKYIVVAHAAITATAAVFVILHESLVELERNALLYGLAGVLALSLSATLLAAYRSFVAKPLQRIREGAERLSSGDRSAHVEVEGGDEMSQLAACVDEMAHNLISVQEDLERQVAERTKDLQSVLIEVRMRSKALEEVNRELAESDRRKTEFLTNVSHELRTPLNAIIGFLSLLKDGLYRNEAERQEYLANAELCATHMLRTIVDVLSSARLEAGRLEVEAADLDPDSVVREVIDILAIERSETPVALRIESEGNARLVADEVKLRQILINLVSNALKFTDSGEVVIRVLPGEDRITFEVEDTGAGIPADEQERIFEKFHQVEGQRTHHKGGTGLGLAITRELVELMGGEIHAHSDGLGKGSIFRFTLPSAKSRETVESPA